MPQGDCINGVPPLWEMFSFLVLKTDFYKEIYVFSLGVQGFSSAMAQIAIYQMEVMTPPNYINFSIVFSCLYLRFLGAYHRALIARS